MAIDYIPVDLAGNPELPLLLRKAVYSLIEARRNVERVRGYMVHLNDGSNFAQIEAKFAVPAGTGSDLFTLIDGTKQQLDGSGGVGYSKDLVERVIPFPSVG